MCGCGPSVDTYGATLNVHDFVQCYAIEGLLVTPRVCRIYRRFTLLLLVLPQTTVLGATLNAKLRGDTVNAQWHFFPLRQKTEDKRQKTEDRSPLHRPRVKIHPQPPPSSGNLR